MLVLDKFFRITSPPKFSEQSSLKNLKLLKNAAKPPRWLSLAALRAARAKIRSSYFQYTPPIYTRRVFRLAPPAAGLGVCQDFERIFEIKNKFLI